MSYCPRWLQYKLPNLNTGNPEISLLRTNRSQYLPVPSLYVAESVAWLSRLTDKLIWPHIFPQTDSILRDIVSESKQLKGSVTNCIYCPPSDGCILIFNHSFCFQMGFRLSGFYCILKPIEKLLRPMSSQYSSDDVSVGWISVRRRPASFAFGVILKRTISQMLSSSCTFSLTKMKLELAYFH